MKITFIQLVEKKIGLIGFEIGWLYLKIFLIDKRDNK